jgi:hypothetical protein
MIFSVVFNIREFPFSFIYQFHFYQNRKLSVLQQKCQIKSKLIQFTLYWNTITWKTVQANVRRLQSRIAKAFQYKLLGNT